MSPRSILSATRSLTCRPKTIVVPQRFAPIGQNRFASSNASKQIPDGVKGPNMDQAPHVSEEQAETDRIMGETPPDLSQGTPVKELLERDPEAKKKAPQVIKEQMNSDPSNQKRSYSTSARRLMATEMQSQQSMDASDLITFNETMAKGLEYPDAGFGHKFPLPDVGAIPRTDHLKKRYDPVVDQVTKRLMRHGKLSVAQKNMTTILDTLRTSAPPAANAALPGRNLLTPIPRTVLPLQPIAYLTAVIDSVAPILKIRQIRGVAGGGANLPVPVPLNKHTRRRQAIVWILDAADKRRETTLADRVAKEIISVAEGKSGIWERRALVHKLAVSARSNVRSQVGGRSRSGGKRLG